MSNKWRNIIRSLTPSFLLAAYRKRKKQQVNRNLAAQKEAGEVLSKSELLVQLQQMGVAQGDVLMVHCAMSKIGYVDGGPETVVDALMEAVGEQGHLLMPSSPNPALQLDYIQSLCAFDVNTSPSAMGAVSEVFRKKDTVLRSVHPTEPVCAWGKKAAEFINEHQHEPTPYTNKSPWYKVMEAKGKILYIGVTLDNAGTNLHTLEDAVDFPYPVYTKEPFEVTVIDATGTRSMMRTFVHNPAMSAKRKCDELLPMFEKEGVLQKHTLGEAQVLVFDAHKMFEVMVEQFHQNGITMYTPNGEEMKV